MRTWFDVRLDLDSLLKRVLEFKMLLVSFRAFETRVFILDFKSLKSFVIESLEFGAMAGTVTNELNINSIDNMTMVPCKTAFMPIISNGIVLYYFLAIIFYLEGS
jgi:hypothetical protein